LANLIILQRYLRQLWLFLNLLVPILNKVLNCILISLNFWKLFSNLRLYFSDGFQLVFSHIVISMLEKYFSWQLLLFIFFDVNEITKISSLTSLRTMVIFARDGFSIVNFYQLVTMLILIFFFSLRFLTISLFIWLNQLLEILQIVLMIQSNFN
jgi:hypothetical protein